MVISLPHRGQDPVLGLVLLELGYSTFGLSGRVLAESWLFILGLIVVLSLLATSLVSKNLVKSIFTLTELTGNGFPSFE